MKRLTVGEALKAQIEKQRTTAIGYVRCGRCDNWIPVFEDEREAWEMGALDGMLCRKCYDIDLDERYYRNGIAEITGY